MSSYIAAGTAYATHGVNTIPFYAYYSMFGFQRIGDLIWAACDLRAKGFLLGGTAGRTTLAGEGLQHQDGQSHLFAAAYPTVVAYDPAYAYEIAVIIRDGIRRMYQEREDIFYYITLGNENYAQPKMPAGVEDGILRGMYLYRPAAGAEGKPRVQLLGSGSIFREALRAQEILRDRFGVGADVWSVTSYKELRREALEVERQNLLHPDREPRTPHVKALLEGAPGPVIAASDYMRSVPEQIQRWVPGLYALGTEGFGRSESRQALRRFFEVDAESIALAALGQLAARGEIPRGKLLEAPKVLGIDPDKRSPLRT
jgi:pyruvate dehydrogenase E1 component